MAILKWGWLNCTHLSYCFPLVEVSKTLGIWYSVILFLSPQSGYSEGLVCEEGLYATVSCCTMAPCPPLVVISSAWLILCSVDAVVSVVFNYLNTVRCGCIPDLTCCRCSWFPSRIHDGPWAWFRPILNQVCPLLLAMVMHSIFRWC